MALHITRREFIRDTSTGCLVLATPTLLNAPPSARDTSTPQQVEEGSEWGLLDPYSIPKFVTPLLVPPAMPRTAKLQQRNGKNIDYYEIAMRQFRQQVLPAGFAATTLWGYGSRRSGAVFNAPSLTIEARHGSPVRVKWVNQLVDGQGRALPHLLPVDPTLHWANPPGGVNGRDGRPSLAPGDVVTPYTGPVPMVTHVHGAKTQEHSDGYPEAWYLPDADDVPDGYARTGTYYDIFAPGSGSSRPAWGPGFSVFEYPNDQRAATLWYHDHTLGMTRQNVYAGPAGFYLLRGGPDDEVLDRRTGARAVLPGPAPQQGDPSGLTYYEIPLAIQDRSFTQDGQLFYPGSRQFFDGFAGPYSPDSDVPPIWNPEFFGNCMMVNGRTWPTHRVEPRRYRLRLLNGCNSRFLLLRFSTPTPFWQIGADGGYLAQPVQRRTLLMAPAERADVIVDFAGLPIGTEVTLQNLAPDEPFGGGEPDQDFEPADPRSTGLVMRFVVAAARSRDASTPPQYLTLPTVSQLQPTGATIAVSLNELMSDQVDSDGEPLEGEEGEVEAAGPIAAQLGTVHEGSGMATGMPMMWSDPVTEKPVVGQPARWEIHNFTVDAHPIHLHQVQFQVSGRRGMDGIERGPDPGEVGFKDTVIAYPDEVTTVVAKFDLAGRFVWHCHILEHEDNEMMRPFDVQPS